MKLDSTNQALLGILRNDSSITLDEIAKRLKVHKNTVRARVRALEEEGVISGYTHRIDYQRLGYNVGVVFRLVLKNMPGLKEKLIKEISSIPQIEVFLTLTGYYNASGTMWTKSMEEAYAILQGMRQNPAIIDLKYDIITKVHMNFLDFNPFTKERMPHQKPGSPPRPLSDLDLRILQRLEQEPAPLADVAKAVRVSVTKVKTRMRRMKEDGILRGEIANFNIVKLGFKEFCLLRLRLAEGADYDKTLRSILNVPGVFDVRSLSGEYDVDVGFLSKGGDDRVAALRRFYAIKGIERGETHVMHTILKGEGEFKPLTVR